MDPNIISLDPIVFGFIKANLGTLTLLLAFLKGLAMLTPNTEDDKIITLLQNIIIPGKKLTMNNKESSNEVKTD